LLCGRYIAKTISKNKKKKAHAKGKKLDDEHEDEEGFCGA